MKLPVSIWISAELECTVHMKGCVVVHILVAASSKRSKDSAPGISASVTLTTIFRKNLTNKYEPSNEFPGSNYWQNLRRRWCSSSGLFSYVVHLQYLILLVFTFRFISFWCAPSGSFPSCVHLQVHFLLVFTFKFISFWCAPSGSYPSGVHLQFHFLLVFTFRFISLLCSP